MVELGMALPSTLAVKLYSEHAEAITMTRVVAQEMPLAELVALMLGLTGKDAARVRELLKRGTFVSGASRYRWQGFEADETSLAVLLAGLPGPDPSRPFAPERCVRAVIMGPGTRIDVARRVGEERRLLRRASFWQRLLSATAGTRPEYASYSYKDRADCYRIALTPEAVESLRDGAGLLRYSQLERQVRAGRMSHLELYVER